MELPYQLLRGSIDSHCHAGPVLRSNPGHVDPIELALEARAYGLRALVYYDVFGWASGTAWMVNRHVPGIRTFGGYLMNSCHGGMNPRAVRTALELGDGCRFISFGSHCTYHAAQYEGTIVDGEYVPFHKLYPKFRDEELSRAVRLPLEGEPVPPELDEILSMIAAYPEVYLNVGHVSKAEALNMVRLAQSYGIAKILIPHPVRSGLSVEEQKALAAEGVFLESCLVDYYCPDLPKTHYYVEPEYMDRGGESPHARYRSLAKYFDVIRAVGPEQIVMATDYGVRMLPSCVQGMRTIITALLDYEFPVEDIVAMTSTNPARLIGLDD